MDPISQNISGVQSLVGSKLNKVNEGASSQNEGVEGEKVDVLDLDLDDDELLQLSKKWTAKYSGYEEALKKRQEACKTYYLGKQKEGTYEATNGMPISANLLFEAEETFLPAALQKNPDPVVFCDNTPEGDKLSTSVKTMLQYHADVLVLRRKLNRVVRHWSIYFIGVMKHGWDAEIEEISSEVRQPKNFILDPDGFIDEYADYEGYLGERITVTARELIDLFPHEKSYIAIMVDGKLGTDVVYTEWWTDKYTFTTFKEVVLDKSKNPFFNYEKEEEQGSALIPQTVKPRNHFARPKKPYTFLSIFSLGEKPHDETSLIEQNIPNQRRVTRRTEQIDYNLSRQNNSTAFSADNFNQEEAKQAAIAMAKGHPVLIPTGKDIDKAMMKMEMTPVPPAFFNALENDKNDLRSIFGTEGLTASPPEPNELATKVVANENHDSTRIGGGIGDAIEQFCDNVFNWWVQLYYVFYDQTHVAQILGQMKSVEYEQLSLQSFDRKVVVSVTPNSMRPKDEVSIANEAVQLFQAGILDPKTLFTRINFPNAEEVAEMSTLWLIDKMTYMSINFPQLSQQVQQAQQQAMMAQQQQQQGQAQMEQQGAQAQQGMQVKQAQVEQDMQHKEATHQQKLKHDEESHKSKVEQQKSVKSPL
jgi:hypothetical protein